MPFSTLDWHLRQPADDRPAGHLYLATHHAIAQTPDGGHGNRHPGQNEIDPDLATLRMHEWSVAEDGVKDQRRDIGNDEENASAPKAKGER